jgi:hypothetical protein
MAQAAQDRLVVGGNFRVRYRLDNQRRDREFIGTYLGWSRFYTMHDFDLRPDAGTASLPGDAIISCELVRKDTPHHQPKMV